MDPIEKLNAMTSKKISNTKELSLKGEPLKGISSASQDNFFRKSQKNFSLSKSDAYGTIIQIMKTDIFQLQEMINDFSYITKMYKLSSRNIFTSKKLTEIDENRDIKILLEKINEDSSTPEKLGRIYACANASELVTKMGVELGLYETFIKKLNELFFILNLKYNGEENSLKISQESFSKFLVVKLALEKMMEKSQNTYINDTDNSLNSSLMNSSQNNFTKKDENNLNSSTGILNRNSNSYITNNILENENNKKIEEYDKIKLASNLNELLALGTKDEKEGNLIEPLIKHICGILKDFLSKLGIGYAELLSKYGIKKDINNNLINISNFNDKNYSNITIESLFSQKLLLEKLLSEKDKLINSNMSFNITGANIVKETSKQENEEIVRKLNEEKKRNLAEIELSKIQNEKYLKEIKIITDKLNEQKSKYEEEISKLRKAENKEILEKDISSLYNIDESTF